MAAPDGIPSNGVVQSATGVGVMPATPGVGSEEQPLQVAPAALPSDARVGNADLVEARPYAAAPRANIVTGAAPPPPMAHGAAVTGVTQGTTPVDPAVRAEIAAAEKLDSHRHNDEAKTQLIAIVNDSKRSRAARAQAALALTDLCSSRQAELYYVKALELDPHVPGAGEAKARLLQLLGKHTEALQLIDTICSKANVESARLLALKADVLLDDAQLPEALIAATRAAMLAPTDNRVQEIYVWALRYNKCPNDALRVARQMLARDPENYTAHKCCASLLGPPTQAYRNQITEQLRAAEDAYRKGQYAKVADHARDLLKLAPNHPLAHNVYLIAQDRLLEDRQGGPGGARLIAALDTPAKQQAVVSQLETICARVKTGAPPRGATPADLFPDWSGPTPEQPHWKGLTLARQALLAYSILPFGALIPVAIERKLKYRIADIGTSCAVLDPSGLKYDDAAAGYSAYAQRARKHGDVILVGVEYIESALHGGMHSFTHEFAHFVHEIMEQAYDKQQRGEPLSDQEADLAAQYADIDKLHKEASAGDQGQRLMGPYSILTKEYFAQVSQAYNYAGGDMGAVWISPKLLFSRNPEAWKFCRRLNEMYGRFPPEVPGPHPPPIGIEEQPSPLELAAIRDLPTHPLPLRHAARAALDHLCALDAPPFEKDGGLSSSERDRQRQVVFKHVGDLRDIARGARPINYLSDAKTMISIMGHDELRAQLGAEIAHLNALAKRPNANDRSALMALCEQAISLQRDAARALNMAPAARAAALERIRAVLVELHGRPVPTSA